MSFASRHNKGVRVFDIDLEGFEFINLETLYKDNKPDTVYTMDGVYINSKSEYGDHPVAIVAERSLLVDLPGHMTEDIREILRSDAEVEEIKAGNAKFVVESYKNKKYKNKICYGIKWVD